MNDSLLSVREIEARDIDAIADYWLNSDPAFLTAMGVDVARMPVREHWIRMLSTQLETPLEAKQAYAVIWEVNGQPVGHSNINKIVFGEEAYLHLHLWQGGLRQQGLGAALVRLTLPWFFDQYQLKRLYCEPYALNPAPNRTLEKVGFEFVREYVTVPGWLNFEQPVKLWVMSREAFMAGREM